MVVWLSGSVVSVVVSVSMVWRMVFWSVVLDTSWLVTDDIWVLTFIEDFAAIRIVVNTVFFDVNWCMVHWLWGIVG